MTFWSEDLDDSEIEKKLKEHDEEIEWEIEQKTKAGIIPDLSC